jgi:hypothetical protein
MGKKLKVGGPATPAEVKAAFRASQERHDREQLQAVMLGQQGQWTLAEIAQALERFPVEFTTISCYKAAVRRGERSVVSTLSTPRCVPAIAPLTKSGVTKFHESLLCRCTRKDLGGVSPPRRIHTAPGKTL